MNGGGGLHQAKAMPFGPLAQNMCVVHSEFSVSFTAVQSRFLVPIPNGSSAKAMHHGIRATLSDTSSPLVTSKAHGSRKHGGKEKMRSSELGHMGGTNRHKQGEPQKIG